MLQPFLRHKKGFAMTRSTRRPLAIATAAAALGFTGAASAQQLPFPLGQIFGRPQTQQTYPNQGYPNAQYGNGAITFYEGENFSGRAVTVYGQETDLQRIGFNDRARSARANGTFVVCEDGDFRGRCERMAGSVPSFNAVGMSGRVSSARFEGGGSVYDGGYGGDQGYGRDNRGRGYGAVRRDGVQGRTAVFFARPNVQGADVAARGQASADQFCRASGYGPAIYYAQGERARRAVDVNGQIVDAPTLRDVLCRTR